MSNYFNDVVRINNEYYLCQDAEFLDEPMVRDVNDLLECERNSAQKMLGEIYE